MFEARTPRLGRARALPVALVVGAAAWSAAQPARDAAGTLPETMAERAAAFLGGLDADHAKLARTGFDDPERRTWEFGPVRREGLVVGDMDTATFERLEALLDTALSEAGMAAWRQIRELESELRRRESTPERVATHRDPDLYWLRVYGEPRADAPWSWRFEGHHIALHVTCAPDAVPTVTPFFLGASPVFVDDPDTPTEELVPSVDAFVEINAAMRAFVASLDEDETSASLPELAPPGDIRMGPGKDELPRPLGLDLRAAGEAPRAKLAALLDRYQSFLDEPLRQFSLEDGYATDAEVGVHFVRWQGTALDERRVWALRAPTFVLEFATTANEDHVHVCLRDAERDFGGR